MAKGYVDGFVIAIPKKNKAKYLKMATEGCEVWKKFGALDYKECVIADAKPKGVTATFSKILSLKPTETVWFSFITYKSKKHRDEVNKKVMAYFAKKYGPDMAEMPFTMDRMTMAGFDVEVTM